MQEQLELFPRHEARFPTLGLISKPPKPGVEVGLSVTVLQSGSAGNATLVRGGGSAVLIDCGLSLRKLLARLDEAETRPEDLSAALITHEHSDHVSGAPALAERYNVPLYMTEGTLRGARGLRKHGLKARVRILPARGWLAFKDGEERDDPPDEVDLSVDWVPLSHDGQETVAYAVQRANFRFGSMTDLGEVTEPARRMLASLDAVSLESNHDVELLRMSSYPRHVIRRILGPRGHLSNAQSAAFLKESGGKRLKTVLLAHISERCNDRERALELLCAAAGTRRRVLLTEHRKAIETLEF